MALPNSNISVAMVRNELGAATNKVGQLCIHLSVNKWSKRKPFVDTRVAPTELRYWRRSNISDYIRCGLMLTSDPHQEWTYPRTWSGNAYRLIDFAGYEKLSGVDITIDLPKQFPIDGSPYAVTYLFYGDSGDSGSIGLQDLFDLENKYVCLQLRLERGGNLIIKNSDRITYMDGAALYGTQVNVSKAEIDSLGVGTITVTLKMVEADGMDLGVLQNPKEFSLKHNSNVVTTFDNNQFLALGFIIYSNFALTEPSKNGRFITSTSQEQVVVSASNRTGGVFQGYYFRAKVTEGQQMGQDYIYALPTYTIPQSGSRTIYIPEFTIELLEAGPVTVEYSIWEGNPQAVGALFILAEEHKLL